MKFNRMSSVAGKRKKKSNNTNSSSSSSSVIDASLTAGDVAAMLGKTASDGIPLLSLGGGSVNGSHNGNQDAALSWDNLFEDDSEPPTPVIATSGSTLKPETIDAANSSSKTKDPSPAPSTSSSTRSSRQLVKSSSVSSSNKRKHTVTHPTSITTTSRGGSPTLISMSASPAIVLPKVQSTATKSVPAFLNKLYNMVNDSTSNLIHWSEDGNAFIVEDQEEFAKEVLPRFFKTTNFSSFVRQLNMYGFHKVPHLQAGALVTDGEPDYLEFANPHFQRNQPDLLCLVTRKKGVMMEKEEGQLDVATVLHEIAAIKRHQLTISADLKNIQRDNQVLWNESVALREQHRRQQDTIDKILRFLASVFSQRNKAPASMAAPAEMVVNPSTTSLKKRKLLLENVVSPSSIVMPDSDHIDIVTPAATKKHSKKQQTVATADGVLSSSAGKSAKSSKNAKNTQALKQGPVNIAPAPVAPPATKGASSSFSSSTGLPPYDIDLSHSQYSSLDLLNALQSSTSQKDLDPLELILRQTTSAAAAADSSSNAFSPIQGILSIIPPEPPAITPPNPSARKLADIALAAKNLQDDIDLLDDRLQSTSSLLKNVAGADDLPMDIEDFFDLDLEPTTTSTAATVPQAGDAAVATVPGIVHAPMTTVNDLALPEIFGAAVKDFPAPVPMDTTDIVAAGAGSLPVVGGGGGADFASVLGGLNLPMSAKDQQNLLSMFKQQLSSASEAASTKRVTTAAIPANDDDSGILDMVWTA